MKLYHCSISTRLIVVLLVVVSFVFSVRLDGKIEYRLDSTGDSRTWNLNPSNPKARRVHFIFESIDINQAELRIIENLPNNRVNLLFTCISCETEIPPPFFSTTGSVVISASGITGVGFRSSSFKIQYIYEPEDSEIQVDDFTSILNMGYAKISPLTINSRVPGDFSQRWVINQNPNDLITFSFGRFALGSTCSATVQVYDSTTTSGNLIFSGCVDADKPSNWFYSTTGSALVVFTVPGPDTLDVNFQLNFYVDRELYHCGSYIQPDRLIDDSMVITDGSKRSNLMRRLIGSLHH